MGRTARVEKKRFGEASWSCFDEDFFQVSLRVFFSYKIEKKSEKTEQNSFDSLIEIFDR